MKKRFDCVVIGAGIIGVSAALSLVKRNCKVLLIDKKDIAAETSYGNAGVIAVSSIIPLNNPSLIKSLLPLLKNNQNGFRYQSSHLLKNIPWLMQFLNFAKETHLQPRASALNALIKRSQYLHNEWLAETNHSHLITHNGWIKLYRDNASFQASQYEHETYKKNDVAYRVLDAKELSDFSNALSPENYAFATHFPQASHIRDPQMAIQAYANLYKKMGGEFYQADVLKLASTSSKLHDNIWQVSAKDGNAINIIESDHVVICGGPWSKEILNRAQLRQKMSANRLLPMSFENGAHSEFENSTVQLECPIYDTHRGFVLTPMMNRLRMTSGVYFADKSDKHKNPLMNQVLQLAQNALPLGLPKPSPWFGSRPTLPDSLPTIGESDDKGLWIAAGHQHIGLSTGPATGELMAQKIINENHHSLLDSSTVESFRVNRFI